MDSPLSVNFDFLEYMAALIMIITPIYLYNINHLLKLISYYGKNAKRGMVMTIKVIVNYPKTKEAVEKLKVVEAKIVLNYLKGILSFDDLNELMGMLEEENI